MTKIQNEEFVEFGMTQYLQVLRRRWLPAGLIVLVCTGLSAFIAIRSNRPIYEASGKLLFQSRDAQSELTGVGSDVGQLELDTVGRNNPLQNQANLLSSGLLLEEVIEKLNMRDPEGELIPFRLVSRNLKVKQIPNTDILQVFYNSADPGFSADFVNTLMRSYLRFNAKNQQSNVESARNFIRGQLPKLRADFERASRDLKDFKSKNGVVTLDSKANEVSVLSAQTLQNERESQLKLESANARVTELRRQLSQVGSVGGLSLVDLSKVNDSAIIQQTISEIQAAEAELEVQQEQYTSDHPIIIELQLKVRSLNNVLQSQTSALIGRPASVDAKNLQLSDLQKKLVSDLSQAEIERQALQEQSQLLSIQKSSLGTNISDFAALEKTQKDLEQTLVNSQKRYLQLLESLEKLDLTEANVRDSNQVQIIESAIKSNVPISGVRLKIILAGAVLGVSLAFGLALLLDILDSKIKSIPQLAKILGYPVLGMIPKHEFGYDNQELLELDEHSFSSPNSVVALSETLTPLHSAYQNLYVNLALLKYEKLPKTFGVVSTLPREGKSEVAANLAATMAQAGQQVLLVDANLKNPSQHKLWKLENNVGLSSVLQDSVNASLVRQKVAPNLYVISSGPAIANMSIMANYAKFITFVSQASQQYDCIIFDSGAIFTDPDAISLSKICEGVLLVACLKYLQIPEVLRTKDVLSQGEIPVLGLIVNQVEETKTKLRVNPHISPSRPTQQKDRIDSLEEVPVSNSYSRNESV